MIGNSKLRIEDERFIRGEGSFTDDINFKDQVYAFFVRSEHAHAKIISIDTEKAKNHPDVLAVYTAEDYIFQGFKGIQHYPNPADAIDATKPSFSIKENNLYFENLHQPLAFKKVRHVGEPIVMIVAKKLKFAKNAADLVSVEYEVCNSVVSADQAIGSTAPQIWSNVPKNICHEQIFGDELVVDSIMSKAHLIVERKFSNSRIVNCQMEPRSAIGIYDENNDLSTLISGSQGANKQKLSIQEALNLKPEQVRVICPDVGGGFGPRTMLYPEQLAVVWASRNLKKPVKWTGSRSEAFVSDYQGRDQIITAKYAFDKYGKILAIKSDWIANIGAHSVSFVPPSNGMRILSTVYDVKNIFLHTKLVYTNTVPTGPYRGAGRPEAHHVIERMLDIAANKLKIDRIQIRNINLIKSSMMPYQSSMGLNYDSGAFEINMHKAIEMADWFGFQERKNKSLSQGKLRGIGLANYIEAPVGAPMERVELSLNTAGEITLVTGTQSQGQGHETTFRQIIQHFTGIAFEKIFFKGGDTKFVSIGGGTHSDRSLRIVSTLINDCCNEIIQQAIKVFVAIENIEISQAYWKDRAIHVVGSEQKIELNNFMEKISKDQKLLEKLNIKSLNENNLFFAAANFKGRIPAHPTGSAVCELEIDPNTGEVDLIQYTSIDDVGQVINPMIVDGQIHGGLAQGIGQALSEGYYMDDQSGQILSGSFMDYGIPRAGVIPTLKIQLTEDPTNLNVLRIKGGGESGITPATACVYNALVNAMSSNEYEELPMPATACVIWSYLQKIKETNANKTSQFL